jgi:hypothetical protein
LNRSTHTNELDIDQTDLNLFNADANGENDQEMVAEAIEQPILVQQQIQYTAKGKPKAKCPNCDGHYEIVTGLRIHALTCNGVN